MDIPDGQVYIIVANTKILSVHATFEEAYTAVTLMFGVCEFTLVINPVDVPHQWGNDYWIAKFPYYNGAQVQILHRKVLTVVKS